MFGSLLFTRGQWRVLLHSIFWFFSFWKSLPFLLFQVLFFLFSNTQSCCEVSLRSWKVLFKPEVFAVFTFQLARWISVGQSVERKGFWQDFWRPTSSSCLSLLQFSHNWLSRVAAKKTPYQMQTEESKSFKIHQWSPCGDAALLRFFTTFEKWEIGAFSLVLSELLTISSCSVRDAAKTWPQAAPSSEGGTCQTSSYARWHLYVVSFAGSIILLSAHLKSHLYAVDIHLIIWRLEVRKTQKFIK